MHELLQSSLRSLAQVSQCEHAADCHLLPVRFSSLFATTAAPLLPRRSSTALRTIAAANFSPVLRRTAPVESLTRYATRATLSAPN